MYIHMYIHIIIHIYILGYIINIYMYIYIYIYIHIYNIYLKFRLTNKSAKKLGASSEDSPFLRPQPVQRAQHKDLLKSTRHGYVM